MNIHFQGEVYLVDERDMPLLDDLSMVAWLQRRIHEVKQQRPLTPTGASALQQTIAELEQCVVHVLSAAIPSASEVIQ